MKKIVASLMLMMPMVAFGQHTGINGAWSGIFLNYDIAAVTVNCGIIVRKIRIIDTVGFNAFPCRPFLQLLKVLLKTVGKFLGNLQGCGADGVFTVT